MPTAKSAAADILRRVPIFTDLTDTELSFLSERAVPRKYVPGELLFSEGDPCAGLFVIETGNVRIFKSSATGREQVLAIDGPGSSVAELPVFDGGNYPASAAAASELTVLFISKQDFHSMCLVHPQVALKVLRVVGKRLRGLVGIIEELSFSTVRHRLISWLLRQAKTEGQPGDRGTVFSLNASHQEMAAQIGTVRELVSRNLARLQAQNFIEVNGKQITILDREGLEADLASMI